MCNQMLGKDPNNFFLQCNIPLFSSIRDYRHLLEMSTKNPTPCKELVTGWPHYIGVKDASIHGIGGIIMGEEKSCIPKVFHLAWPEDIKDLRIRIPVQPDVGKGSKEYILTITM